LRTPDFRPALPRAQVTRQLGPVVNTDIVHLVVNASPTAKVVLAILLIFSAISWGIILYKLWQYNRAARHTASFLDVFRKSSKF
jgi:biopolymer transport protein TolQ